MALYRIYKIDDEGHIVGPPFEFDGVDDDAAVAEARKYVDGHRMEVWESSRHIATIAVPEHGTWLVSRSEGKNRPAEGFSQCGDHTDRSEGWTHAARKRRNSKSVIFAKAISNWRGFGIKLSKPRNDEQFASAQAHSTNHNTGPSGHAALDRPGEPDPLEVAADKTVRVLWLIGKPDGSDFYAPVHDRWPHLHRICGRGGLTLVDVTRRSTSPLPYLFSAGQVHRIRSTATCVVPCRREARQGSVALRNGSKSVVRLGPCRLFCDS